MGQIIARLQHDDGKYHYGASTTPAPQLGPLFGITATGNGTLAKAPPNPATEAEHKSWLVSHKENGFDVNVIQIEEPVT